MTKASIFKRRGRVGLVAAILDVSTPTVWRWAATRPDFPKPTKQGPATTTWDLDEVEAWAQKPPVIIPPQSGAGGKQRSKPRAAATQMLRTAEPTS